MELWFAGGLGLLTVFGLIVWGMVTERKDRQKRAMGRLDFWGVGSTKVPQPLPEPIPEYDGRTLLLAVLATKAAQRRRI